SGSPPPSARTPSRHAPAAVRRASSYREHDLGAAAGEIEAAAQLIAHERAHDGEARAGRRIACTLPFVGDREHDVAVPLCKLDPHRTGPVLERVLEQLTEDERERGCATAGERDRLERGRDIAAGAEP